MKKRWLSIALIAGLLLNTQVALAAEQHPQEVVCEISGAVTGGLASDAVAGLQNYSLDEYDGCYGNQLSGLARELYDGMAQFTEVGTETVTITLEEPIRFQAEYGGNGSVIPNEESEEAFANLDYAFSSALGAFLYDSPKTFWIQGAGYESPMGGTWIEGDTYQWTIVSIHLSATEYYSGAYESYEVFEEGVEDAVEELASTFSDADSADVKARKIHDWICERATYNYDALAGGDEWNYAHTPYGVFAEDLENAVVCEGYAKAYKILCDEFDIPCAIVVGVAGIGDSAGAHMWNSTKMPDRKWYGVDVTFDDNLTEQLGYEEGETDGTYFAVGSQTKVLDGMIYAEDHLPSTQFMDEESQPFVYPVLAEERYTGGLGLVKGDVDGDGEEVGMEDLLYLLKIVSGRIDPDSLSSEQYWAGDVQGNDGVIDMEDLLKMLRYVSGRIVSLDD